MCHINIPHKEADMELFIVLTTAVIIIFGLMWFAKRDLKVDEDHDEDSNK
jgi:hypothetical protein